MKLPQIVGKDVSIRLGLFQIIQYLLFISIFQPSYGVHSENINNALQYMENIPNDVAIISGDNEEIQTNKYLLSVFSPTLRNLLSSPLDTFQIIFVPDFSTLSIRNLLNILNSGFSVTEKISNEDIKEITDTAQLLSMDIKEFCYDENVPSLMESKSRYCHNWC